MDKKLYSSFCLDITTKDGREFRILLMNSDKKNFGNMIYERIKKISFFAIQKHSFAFSYKRKFPINGWKVYNDDKEWERMGIVFGSKV